MEDMDNCDAPGFDSAVAHGQDVFAIYDAGIGTRKHSDRRLIPSTGFCDEPQPKKFLKLWIEGRLWLRADQTCPRRCASDSGAPLRVSM